VCIDRRGAWGCETEGERGGGWGYGETQEREGLDWRNSVKSGLYGRPMAITIWADCPLDPSAVQLSGGNETIPAFACKTICRRELVKR